MIGEATQVDKTYAGGDASILVLATIAIFQGRKAAETIHNRFHNIEPEPVQETTSNYTR